MTALCLGAGLILLPSLLVVALFFRCALRRDRHEGDSRPAADEAEPVTAGPVSAAEIRHGHKPADHAPLFADPAPGAAA